MDPIHSCIGISWYFAEVDNIDSMSLWHLVAEKQLATFNCILFAEGIVSTAVPTISLPIKPLSFLWSFFLTATDSWSQPVSVGRSQYSGVPIFVGVRDHNSPLTAEISTYLSPLTTFIIAHFNHSNNIYTLMCNALWKPSWHSEKLTSAVVLFFKQLTRQGKGIQLLDRLLCRQQPIPCEEELHLCVCFWMF